MDHSWLRQELPKSAVGDEEADPRFYPWRKGQYGASGGWIAGSSRDVVQQPRRSERASINLGAGYPGKRIAVLRENVFTVNVHMQPPAFDGGELRGKGPLSLWALPRALPLVVEPGTMLTLREERLQEDEQAPPGQRKTYREDCGFRLSFKVARGAVRLPPRFGSASSANALLGSGSGATPGSSRRDSSL